MPERIDQLVEDVAGLKSDMKAAARVREVECEDRKQMKKDLREIRDAMLRIQGGKALLFLMFGAAATLGGVVAKTATFLIGR